MNDPSSGPALTLLSADGEYVWDALVAGASGFIRKRATSTQIAVHKKKIAIVGRFFHRASGSRETE